MKNSNDTIGDRTRDLLACRAVPRSPAPPRVHSTVYRGQYLSLRHNIHCSYLNPCNFRAEMYIEIVSPTTYGSIFKGPSGTLCNRVQRHPVEDRAAVTEHSSRREHGRKKQPEWSLGLCVFTIVRLSSRTSRYFKSIFIY